LRFLIAVLIAPHPERARVELTSATIINFFVFIQNILLTNRLFFEQSYY
ncbi:hypothetical protein EASG_05729, partial [Escherichia coli H383]